MLFTDLNGDGRDDYVWVSPSGAVTAFLNGGGSDVRRPVWHPKGVIASGFASSRSEVRFADINGIKSKSSPITLANIL